MIDIERLIGPRIQRSKKHLSPQVNPAIKAHHEAMIKTLQSAPRNESELAELIEQKKQEFHRASKIEDCEPLHSELDALEWLHALVVVSKIDPVSAQSIV